MDSASLVSNKQVNKHNPTLSFLLSESQSHPYLNRIPGDVWGLILGWLPTPDFIRAKPVCRRWKEVSNSPAVQAQRVAYLAKPISAGILTEVPRQIQISGNHIVVVDQRGVIVITEKDRSQAIVSTGDKIFLGLKLTLARPGHLLVNQIGPDTHGMIQPMRVDGTRESHPYQGLTTSYEDCLRSCVSKPMCKDGFVCAAAQGGIKIWKEGATKPVKTISIALNEQLIGFEKMGDQLVCATFVNNENEASLYYVNLNNLSQLARKRIKVDNYTNLGQFRSHGEWIAINLGSGWKVIANVLEETPKYLVVPGGKQVKGLAFSDTALAMTDADGTFYLRHLTDGATRTFQTEFKDALRMEHLKNDLYAVLTASGRLAIVDAKQGKTVKTYAETFRFAKLSEFDSHYSFDGRRMAFMCCPRENKNEVKVIDFAEIVGITAQELKPVKVQTSTSTSSPGSPKKSNGFLNKIKGLLP